MNVVTDSDLYTGRHGRPPDSGDTQWSAHTGGGDQLQLRGQQGLRLGNITHLEL